MKYSTFIYFWILALLANFVHAAYVKPGERLPTTYASLRLPANYSGAEAWGQHAFLNIDGANLQLYFVNAGDGLVKAPPCRMVRINYVDRDTGKKGYSVLELLPGEAVLTGASKVASPTNIQVVKLMQLRQPPAP